MSAAPTPISPEVYRERLRQIRRTAIAAQQQQAYQQQKANNDQLQKQTQTLLNQYGYLPEQYMIEKGKLINTDKQAQRYGPTWTHPVNETLGLNQLDKLIRQGGRTAKRQLYKGLYNATSPVGYQVEVLDKLNEGDYLGAAQSASGRAINFVRGVAGIDNVQKNQSRQQQQEIQGGRYKFPNEAMINRRDDSFRLLMQLPQRNNSYRASAYRPAKGTNSGSYLEYTNPKDNALMVLPSETSYDFRTQSYRHNQEPISNKEFMQGKPLLVQGEDTGTYTVSRGKDPRGSYVSAHDLWDLKQGIGTPFNVYTRQYDKSVARRRGGRLLPYLISGSALPATQEQEEEFDAFGKPKKKLPIGNMLMGGASAFGMSKAKQAEEINQQGFKSTSGGDVALNTVGGVASGLGGMEGKVAQAGMMAAEGVGKAWNDKKLGEGVSVSTGGEAAVTGAIKGGTSGFALGNKLLPGVGGVVGGAVGLTAGAVTSLLGNKKVQSRGRAEVKRRMAEKSRLNNEQSTLLYNTTFAARRGGLLSARMYAKGGSLIVKGALHSEKNKFNHPSFGKKGIPVLSAKNGEKIAEIEHGELVLSDALSASVEQLSTSYARSQQPDLLTRLGKLLLSDLPSTNNKKSQSLLPVKQVRHGGQTNSGQETLLIPHPNGSLQMMLSGGNRVFSRPATKKLQAMTRKKYPDTTAIGAFIHAELVAQDKRPPEFVRN